ncbi:MAG: MaoC family dehydratase [Acidobacteriota bacterium]|nr:MaoC family dehydratase [Acidobacteriota bacterium]
MTALAYAAHLRIGEKRYRERFGLAYEQFRTGQRFQHRPGLTLSQQDNRDECLDTLNQQMLHFDAAFASHTEWGRCLMDSTLTTRVVMGMTWKTFARKTQLIGFDEIALTSPVFGGDTIYAESEILEIAEVLEDATAGRIKVRTRGLNQQGQPVATLVHDLLVERTNPDDSGPNGDLAERHASHVQVAPGVFRERMGLFFEDVDVGETYEHRPGKTFSAEDSARQTVRTLDQTEAVVDWYGADRTRVGPPDVNPMHVLAVVTGMMTKTFSRIVANLAWQHVRFPEPVRDGDTVYAESTILGTRASQSRPGQGIIHVRTTAHTHDGRTVCGFERKILVYGRRHGPYEAAGY